MPADQNEITFFAKTNFRNLNRTFGIKTDDRRRHMYLIGKTGMGKTTVIENMVISDIRSGKGLALVDPHGDLIEKVLDFIPSYRINDVVYFDPADLEFPIGFNVLESVNPDQRHLVASGLMGVFTKIWEGVWSARMEYILNNCILALLEYPGSTMLGIARILVDKNYRKKVVDRITDPIVKSFWIDEYASYNDRFRNEAIAPIQNKVGQFLSSSVIRNIVGQSKSTINLRELMDQNKILLLNLSKGRIGEDNSALLGAMMITRLQLAAMSRVDIPEKERNDFYLYVDEFQNFATESFASILSEARKYRLNLIIAHQYIEQLDEEVRAAVFGNVGTIMCFRVGAADSEFLAKEFFPTFIEEDLVNLTKYDVYLKLMIDGVASAPFSATTLPPVEGQTNNRDKVIRVSRERYSQARADVEDRILRWSGVQDMYRASADADNRAIAGDEGSYKRKHQIVPSEQRMTPRVNKPFVPKPAVQAKPAVDFKSLTDVEIEPATTTISLSQALARKPAPFSGKPRLTVEPKIVRPSPSRPVIKPIQSSASMPTQTKSHNPHKLQPGKSVHIAK
ncbi:MAG: type IV secretion system DNA-binding domain-containing protein [Candidatus Kerfeldbacteria bacterium]|nr:type IV secretion system DNA-binding domain-containing protein [Candidatus Kerfeldbacteria bacterium]